MTLLSGDRAAVAQHVAKQLGIENVVADTTPHDKLAYVQLLQSRGEQVAMIGDGINDAPVLAAAHVSMTMAGSADVARATADAVLMTDRLHMVVAAVDLAMLTRRVIKQRLSWAVAYNMLALPLAALGYITPWLAESAWHSARCCRSQRPAPDARACNEKCGVSDGYPVSAHPPWHRARVCHGRRLLVGCT